MSNLLDPLLRPFEILLHFLGCFHAICEVCAVVLKSPLSESLQFHEFAVLGIEFARSVFCQSRCFQNIQQQPVSFLPCANDDGDTHVCACFAKLLSRGSRSTLVLSFSLSSSTRSIPEEPSSLLLLPESEVNDGTAELAGVLRLGGETAARLYGAGYARGIFDEVLPVAGTGRE